MAKKISISADELSSKLGLPVDDISSALGIPMDDLSEPLDIEVVVLKLVAYRDGLTTKASAIDAALAALNDGGAE
jgi:hypothetical protein